jgi:hypothetical protein
MRRTTSAFFLASVAACAAGCSGKGAAARGDSDPVSPDTTIGPPGSADSGDAAPGDSAAGDTDGDSAPGDSAAGDPGAPLTLVEPIARGDTFVLEFGDTWFAVDPALGGRITRFAAGGADLLTSANVDPANWGATFWTSPQGDWGWPPVAALDSAPYASALDGDTIVLTSSPGTVGSATLVVEKRFTADLRHEAVTQQFTLTNVGTTDATLAGWGVARVATGGLTLFPSGSATTSMVGSFPYTEQGGLVWFDEANAPHGGDVKLAADTTGGWLAHVAPNGAVLVATFPDVPVADQAPGEGEVELYANAAGTYVEVETQGPLTTLAPGASTSWTVTWAARTLPADVPATVGSDALLAFVRAVALGG